MERIQLVNPERITWCCTERGITPNELASELKISTASIEKVMAREDGLTFNQLQKIAKYFGRGIMFFLEDGPVNEMQVHSPQFRTLANQKPKLSTKIKTIIERAEKQRDLYVSLREDLDSNDELWFNPPDLSGNDYNQIADIVRQWLNLANKNNFETYRSAVEAVGILVFQSQGYNGQWKIAKEDPVLGFSLYDETCPVIVIKKQAWLSMQSFTLMHELGHILLHKTSFIDDDQDLYSREGKEQEANAFAGHLLVPNAFLESIRDIKRPSEVSEYDEWLAPFRKEWGVSSEVILRRLRDTGQLSTENYVEYREWRAKSDKPQRSNIGNRQYRHREPKHIFGDKFVRIVLDALNEQHITLAKASGYLDSIKIKDVKMLERYYANL